MADGPEGAMVGRDAELDRLVSAYRRAAEGEPRVVVVVGEAGIGKSRLLGELGAAARAQGGRSLAGACLDLADGGLPLAPLAEAMRALAADEPTAAALGVGDATGPIVGGVTGDADEPLAAPRLYEGMLGFLARLAASRPTVLAIEDLHWVDRATRDLLTYLVRNLTNERILLVLTARSEDVAPELAGWLAELGRHPRVERVVLDRLDRAGVRRQLVALLGTDPGRTRTDRIFARSEGNPLFVEELVSADADAVPATLVELTTARLSRLSPAAREIVRVVAVGGRSIDESLVVEVAELPTGEVRAALREAVEQRILVASPSDRRIGFRHALVREVAAAELLSGERASLHARLASTLAARPELAEPSPAGAAAELAYHWEAADDAPQALAAAIEAGAAAARVAAWADADRQYARALRLAERTPLPDGLDRAELYRRASEAAELDADFPRARRLAETALEALGPTPDPERAAWIETRIGYLAWAQGDTDEALASYERAAARLPEEPPTPIRARVLASMANALFGKGRYAEARDTATSAVEASIAAGAAPEEARARNVLGSVRVAIGEVDAGLADLERSRDLAATAGPADMRVISAYNLAINLAMAGRLSAAEDAARLGREAARAEGLERRYGLDLAALEGDVLTRLGRWDAAASVMDDALARDPDDGAGSIYLAIARARLHALRGEVDEAKAWSDRIDRTAGEHLDADVAGYLARARAELALVEGRPADALDVCRAGLAPLEGTEDHFVRSPLLVLAVTAAAENAESARARRDEASLSEARAAVEPLVDELRIMAHSTAPTARALAALAEAEWARLERGNDPEPWRAAGPVLAAVPDPHAAAWASARAAEAALRRDGTRADVSDELRAAAATATAIGAAPLQRLVEDLARRSRVELRPDPEPPASTDAAPSGGPITRLSRRELEVLRLVASGRTNGEIADELFITRKTAGVHVTHILDKLGVANRVEAAMAASRLGLLDRDPAASE